MTLLHRLAAVAGWLIHRKRAEQRLDDELQAFIRENAAEFVARQEGTRSGADPEDLHKFRVATRRIRSLLRSTRGQLDDRGEGERLRAELKWLASLLGDVRDRDVLIDYLVGELDSLDGAPLGALLQVVGTPRSRPGTGLNAVRGAARLARASTRAQGRRNPPRGGETRIQAPSQGR